MCVSTLITIWPGTGLNLLFHSRRSQLPDIYQNNVVTIHNHFKDFSITFLRINEVKKFHNVCLNTTGWIMFCVGVRASRHL